MAEIVIFTNQTSNVSSAPVNLNFPKNTCLVKVWGTWNGASVILQTFAPGGTSTPINIYDEFGNPFTFTADRQVTLEGFVFNEPIIAVLSSAGASTSLSLTLQDN